MTREVSLAAPMTDEYEVMHSLEHNRFTDRVFYKKVVDML